jgi:hypothetical protein
MAPQHAELRPQDVAIAAAPMAVAVEEYKKARRVLCSCLPVSVAALVHVLRWAWQTWVVRGWVLELRWVLVLAAVCAGVVAFFMYGVYQVLKAIYSIKQPCCSLEMRPVSAGPPGTKAPAGRPEAALVPTVVAHYSERLGNNVFQYVVARLRAGYSNAAFAAPLLPKPFDKLSWTAPAPLHQLHPASAHAGAVGHAEGKPALQLSSSDVDAAALLADPRYLFGSGSWLNHPASGYVMNTCLFVGHERTIAGWLRPSLDQSLVELQARHAAARGSKGSATGDSSTSGAASAASAAPVLEWQPNDVAIHVRLGDILWGHHCAYRPLPVSFFVAALQTVSQRLGGGRTDASVPWQRRLGRVVLVTEDATDEIVTRVAARLEAILADFSSCAAAAAVPATSAGATAAPSPRVLTQSLSVHADFLTLYTAPNLILSISSFSWWAGFLGRAGCVVMPDYGLFKTHVWFPRDGCPAPHDMTIRDGLWHAGQSAPACELAALLPAEAQRGDVPTAGRTTRAARSGERREGRADESSQPLGPALQQAVRCAVAHAAVFGTEPRGSSADATPAGTGVAGAEAAPLTYNCAALTAAALDGLVSAVQQSLPACGPSTFPDRLYAAMAKRQAEIAAGALSESQRVVRLQLPHLQRWDGYFKHTVESLFDC